MTRAHSLLFTLCLPRSQPYPFPRRSTSFLVFEWPGAYIRLGTPSPCIYPISFLFEFLVSFPPSFHLARNPILSRAGFLTF